MLASMSSKLQKQDEYMNDYDMMVHLQELFGAWSRTKRYKIFKELFRCRMVEGTSLTIHVLRIISYIEKLSQLGIFICHVSVSHKQTGKHVT